MAACLEQGIDVAFTIDGPRGPAYVAKAGAVTLARHTGQAILPFHITSRRRIRLGSWDRLQIPLPFTRALALVGEPIFVGRDAAAGPGGEVDRVHGGARSGVSEPGVSEPGMGKPGVSEP